MIIENLKKVIKNIKQNLDSEIIRLTLVFSVLVFILTITYLPNHKVIGLDDPFFHIRFAQIFQEQGFDAFRDFKWIYFSKMAEEPQGYFVYYNFLFYLVLIPFSWLDPPILGIKLFGIIFGAFSLTVLYYFFRKLNIKYPEFWLLFGIASFGGLLGRFLVARPFALAPALLIILLYFLHKRQYWGITILSIVYFFWHPATFFFPLLVVSVYLLFEKFWQNQADWKKLVSVVVGTGIAYLSSLFFAPGLTAYLKEMILGTVSYIAFQQQTAIPEGGEVYGRDLLNYLHSNQLIFILLLILVLLEIYRYWNYRKNRDTSKLSPSENTVLQSTLFFLTIGFLFGIAVSFRYQDFFVFFVLAYIPLAINELWTNLEIQINPEAVKRVIKMSLIILLFAFSVNNLIAFKERLASGPDFQSIEQAALWLKKNTLPQTVIFNASWSDFTRLFYFNTQNYYIIGLEPHFLLNYNSELYWLWHNLSYFGSVCDKEKCDYQKRVQITLKNGEVTDKANEIIKNIFKADYIISPREQSVWLNSLMANPEGFELVYQDSWYQIHQVIVD